MQYRIIIMISVLMHIYIYPMKYLEKYRQTTAQNFSIVTNTSIQHKSSFVLPEELRLGLLDKQMVQYLLRAQCASKFINSMSGNVPISPIHKQILQNNDIKLDYVIYPCICISIIVDPHNNDSLVQNLLSLIKQIEKENKKIEHTCLFMPHNNFITHTIRYYPKNVALDYYHCICMIYDRQSLNQYISFCTS